MKHTYRCRNCGVRRAPDEVSADGFAVWGRCLCGSNLGVYLVGSERADISTRGPIRAHSSQPMSDRRYNGDGDPDAIRDD